MILTPFLKVRVERISQDGNFLFWEIIAPLVNYGKPWVVVAR